MAMDGVTGMPNLNFGAKNDKKTTGLAPELDIEGTLKAMQESGFGGPEADGFTRTPTEA
ncbi:MAG TPA: hypothetical protein V6C52_13720 [Coleofasciculaceae cyanobacterium]